MPSNNLFFSSFLMRAGVGRLQLSCFWEKVEILASHVRGIGVILNDQYLAFVCHGVLYHLDSMGKQATRSYAGEGFPMTVGS